MNDIEMYRPRIEDQDELNHFFCTVIQDTFAKEGLTSLQEDIKNEITTKINYLESDFQSDGCGDD